MEADVVLLDRLRAGDESAFVALVRRYHVPLLRFAETFVPSRAVAEEVVQDTWLGVVRGLQQFEGRSSFKTWLFRILANRARTAGGREHRTVPFEPWDEPAVPRDRFNDAGAWATPPAVWAEEAEDRIQAAELAKRVRETLHELPEAQRQVILLRDIEGVPANDVCDLLGISDGNQRVLLHRARVRVRGMLERELERT